NSILKVIGETMSSRQGRLTGGRVELEGVAGEARLILVVQEGNEELHRRSSPRELSDFPFGIETRSVVSRSDAIRQLPFQAVAEVERWVMQAAWFSGAREVRRIRRNDDPPARWWWHIRKEDTLTEHSWKKLNPGVNDKSSLFRPLPLMFHWRRSDSGVDLLEF